MRAAAFETGFKTNAELKILGLNCCIELEYRSDYIIRMFSLPSRGNKADLGSVSQLEQLVPERDKKSNKKSDVGQGTFSYQPSQSNRDLELIGWFKNNPLNKEKAIQAIRAYWLPIANSLRESQSEFELKKMALNCCSMLEGQSDYIRNILSLPPRVTYLIESPIVDNVNNYDNGYTNSPKDAEDFESHRSVEVERDRAQIAQEKQAEIAQEKQAEIVKDVMEDIMRLD
ncbi:MAG: hypothetical protein QNJ38_21290 [Prochloraceae cyanobacterium]|nr:hypothetical protein [Prochloraceae cyanobacterium]